MSDTPRTDKAVKAIKIIDREGFELMRAKDARRLERENTALRAHAERLAEALNMIIEIETGTSMAVIGWTDAMDKAIEALTLYRAENPKV